MPSIVLYTVVTATTSRITAGVRDFPFTFKIVIRHMKNANTTYNNPLTDNPSLLDKDGGCGVTAINIEASEYYYFETTIKGQNSSNGNFYFGLAHLTDSPGLNQRWLEFMVEPSSNAFRIIERYGWGQFSTVGGYENIKARSWFNDLDYTNFKMAIAREGDALYTFINDIYVGTYYSGDLSIATFPGIISVADGDPTLMTEGSGIEYTNFAKAEGQAEVKAKLEAAGLEVDTDEAGIAAS